MEYLPRDPILIFNENTLNVVRKLYDLDKPDAMKQAIDSLEKWLKKQHHFTVKDFDRTYLERAIIMSKGSLERTKERFDKMLTMRTLMPKFFDNHDIIKDYQNLQGIIIHTALPEMTEEYDRVYICRVKGRNFTAKMYLEGYRYTFMLSEYFRAHDYARSYYFVIDYSEASIPQLVSAADLTDLRDGVHAQLEGNGLKVKGICIITDSKLVETLIAIAKSCVSEKVAKRICCLKSREELLDYIPKNVLPKDYGGSSDKTLDEIDAAWIKVLTSDEYTKNWAKMLAARTDESLRSKEKFNEEYMGMPGSFRVLSVD